MKNVDGPPDIETFSTPIGRHRVGTDIHAEHDVGFPQHVHCIVKHHRQIRNIGDATAIGPTEHQCSIGFSGDLIAVFVNRTMVSAAEHRQV